MSEKGFSRGKRQRREHEKDLQNLLFGKDVSVPTKQSYSGSNFDEEKKQSGNAVAVWDDDEEDIKLDLDSVNRLKKLKKGDVNMVSGSEFTSLLQDRFKTRDLAWAAVNDDTNGGSEIDGDDEGILNQAGSMVQAKDGRRFSADQRGRGLGDDGQPLPPTHINIQRMIDANAAEPSSDAVNAVKFHAGGQVLLTAGADKYLRFFRIDGDKNEKQLAVRFGDMSISCASFLGTSSSSAEVVLSGRKPYFYSYDVTSGTMNKINGLMGKGLKSHEVMAVSPLGTRIAFAGHGGYVHVVCGRMKTWQMDLKMNTPCRSIVFIDEDTIATSGLDADVYMWDLRYHGKCISRFAHEDGTCTSSLAAYRHTSEPWFLRNHRSRSAASDSSTSSSCYLSVGAESGVMTLFEGSARAAAGSSEALSPVKSVMNLVTKVTTTAFHPSGQLMAIASEEKKDHMKLIHLPTCTVFGNWPTDRTPLGRVSCLDFSSGGAYLAAGNKKGRVLLYKVNHFSSA